MTITKIPAHEIVHCDICKVECTRANRRQSGRLIVDCAGLDYQGAPVGPGGFQRDLCDDCLHQLTDALRERAEAIAARAPAGIGGGHE